MPSFIILTAGIGLVILLEQYPLQRDAGRLTIRVWPQNSLQAPTLLFQAIRVASQPEPGAHHQRRRAAEPAGDEAGGKSAEVVN